MDSLSSTGISTPATENPQLASLEEKKESTKGRGANPIFGFCFLSFPEKKNVPENKRGACSFFLNSFFFFFPEENPPVET